MSPSEKPPRGGRQEFVYFTTAPAELIAETWRSMLAEEGISAVLRPGDTMTGYLGVTPYPCRILVAEDQLERAREVMEQRLSEPAEE